MAAQSGCLESRVWSLVCMAGRAPSRRTIMVVSASELCHSRLSPRPCLSRTRARASAGGAAAGCRGPRVESSVQAHKSHGRVQHVHVHVRRTRSLGLTISVEILFYTGKVQVSLLVVCSRLRRFRLRPRPTSACFASTRANNIFLERTATRRGRKGERHLPAASREKSNVACRGHRQSHWLRREHGKAPGCWVGRNRMRAHQKSRAHGLHQHCDDRP